MESQLDMFNPNKSHLENPDELIGKVGDIDLHEYDYVCLNSSVGKDSICAIWQMVEVAHTQDYPLSKLFISHQDLGESEWPGTHELLKKQAEYFGLKYYISRRVNFEGKEETLLEYVQRRKMWMGSKARFCTSDFKRSPGNKIVRRIANEMGAKKVLQVFGFRKDESPARSKRPVLSVNKLLTTKSRLVHDYLPIHEWSSDRVWEVIRGNGIPYHKAYDLGMPRLSCVFCIFSPPAALVLAGKHNPELLDKYIAVEDEIQHTFRKDFSLHEVKDMIARDEDVSIIDDWIM